MPRQTRVTISDNGDGTANLQVGGSGIPVNIASLFDRGLNPDEAKTMLRLCFAIGGYAQPASSEFITAINRTLNGIQLRAGSYKVNSVDLVDSDNGVYQFNMTAPHNAGSFGVQMSLAELAADPLDPTTLPVNLAAFLRIGGFASLTAAAISAIDNATFWY